MSDVLSSVQNFVPFFYDTFMLPLIDILKSTVVLGFPLYGWFISTALVSMAIRFIKRFFGSNDD